MTAIEYPAMQKGANFNLDAVKAKIAEATARRRTRGSAGPSTL
jgi:hypothetical protein